MMTPSTLGYVARKRLNATHPLVKVASILIILTAAGGLSQGILWAVGLQSAKPFAAEIALVNRDNELLQQSINELHAQVRNNSLEQALAARLALTEELDLIKNEIIASTEYLIPPAKMPNILRNLLQKHRSLELIEFVTIDPVPLGTTSDALPVYRHGIRIRVKGTFTEMTAWLNEIEQLPWVLNWDHLVYSMERWPTGNLTLELHTLSREEAWLDI